MAFHKPEKIARLVVEDGIQKVRLPLSKMLMLGFLGGAFISLAFLLYIRVVGNLPQNWGSLESIIGGAVFPIGLILVVLAGGELVTGNMLSVSMVFYAKKISLRHVTYNWFWITLANFGGTLFISFFFGHIVGLTETGPYLNKTIWIAQEKIQDSFIQSLISAIGCNWLVCLAIWLAYGADDFIGKVIGIWFPLMAIAVIGFQQVVVNMFIISAGIFAGELSWSDFATNFIPVFLGNVIGGAGFVSFIYFVCYKKQVNNEDKMNKVTLYKTEF